MTKKNLWHIAFKGYIFLWSKLYRRTVSNIARRRLSDAQLHLQFCALSLSLSLNVNVNVCNVCSLWCQEDSSFVWIRQFTCTCTCMLVPIELALNRANICLLPLLPRKVFVGFIRTYSRYIIINPVFAFLLRVPIWFSDDLIDAAAGIKKSEYLLFLPRHR